MPDQLTPEEVLLRCTDMFLRQVPYHIAYRMLFRAIVQELSDEDRNKVWTRLSEARKGINALLEQSLQQAGLDQSQSATMIRQHLVTIDDLLTEVFQGRVNPTDGIS